MRIMRPSDIERLRGQAAKSTHLARYEHANDAPARAEVTSVLDVACPHCGVDAGAQCAQN
jgi:hypothetical protein